MNRALSDVRLRAGKHPALLFDRLHALGLVVLHDSDDAAQEAIARDARNGDAITVATNDEVRELNARIRNERVRAGLVDDHRTTNGSAPSDSRPSTSRSTRTWPTPRPSTAFTLA